MYHDPNFDWIAHYDTIAMRMEAKAKDFADGKVPHAHLTSGKPLRRPRTMALVPKARVHGRIIYAEAIGPVRPVRDYIKIATPGPKGNFREIIQEVSEKYGVPVRDIMGPRRQKHLMKPRFEVFYRMKTECAQLSLPQIGRLMGGRDHTTALHAIKRFEAMLASGEARL